MISLRLGEAKGDQMIFIKTFKSLLSLLRPNARLKLVLILLLSVFLGFLEMIGISLIFSYIGSLTGTSSGGMRTRILFELAGIDQNNFAREAFIMRGGIALIVFFLVKNVCLIIADTLHSKYIKSEMKRISNKLLEAYTAMPYENLIKAGVSKLEALIVKFPNVFSLAFDSVVDVIANSIKISLICTLLMFIDSDLTIAGIVLLGSTSALTYIFTKYESRKLREDNEKGISNQKDLISDVLNGYIDINLMDTRESMLRRFNSCLSQSASINNKQAMLKKVPRMTNEVLFIIAIVAAAVYFYLSDLDLNTALSRLFVFTFAGLKLNNCFTSLTIQLQELYFSAKLRNNLLKEVREIAPGLFFSKNTAKQNYPQHNSNNKGLEFKEALRVKDISFRYPLSDERVIKNINLEIKPGELIGICGKSGGGKTTLALLIMGLLKAQEGQITCDGIDINEDPAAWHKIIGYVGQTPYLSNSSIKENVAFGYPADEIDEERVWECLRLAQLDKFVRNTGKKLDFRLRDSGSNLSGGQKQRLCIARALYKDPSILIFDEAVSALDAATEKSLKEAINSFKETKTIIFISHRISAIQAADKIYVIKDGQIIDQGSYEELKANNSKFVQ